MISPDFLDELERFAVTRKRNVSAQFAGEEETVQVGEGLTFRDYRRYAPGDDTRLIDWKLYARTNELYVQQFERERNLTVHVLVDASASMGYGDGDERKFEYAAKLGLGFAYLTAAEGNDFRFSVFADGFDRLDGNRSNEGEVLRLVDRCNDVDPGGEADFAAALEAYAATVSTRSLVFVASDFLADVDDVDDGFDALGGHAVEAAHVLTPAELDPPTRGDTVFLDVESTGRLRTYFGERLREAYRRRLDEHVAAVASSCRDRNVRHVLVDTGADFFDSFASVWVE